MNKIYMLLLLGLFSAQICAQIPTCNLTATNNTLCAGASATLTASSSASNVSACASSVLPSNLQTGLVGYWPFCGNANDASGNGNNGTVNGATLTTDRFGNANSAYSFDGVDDYITIPRNTVFTTEISVSGWIYCNSISGVRDILTNWQSSASQRLMNLYTENGLLKASIQPSSQVYAISNMLTTGQWKFVCSTFDGQYLKIYIDGQLSANIASPSSNLAINQRPNWFVAAAEENASIIEFFYGKIDDIGIWNRALTASEIQQLYNQGQTTYSWSNGATTPSITVSPAQTTTYTCTVTTNGTSCSSDVTVTVNPLPTVNAGIDQTICAGTAVTLSGSGANTYSWNNSVSNGVAFTPVSTATYTVTGTNTATGCSNTDQVVVNVNALPTVNAGVDQTVCAGTNVTLSGSGANTYSWNNSVSNGVAFTPVSTATYTVTGTNTTTGCTNTDQVVVNVNPLPNVFQPIDQVVCCQTVLSPIVFVSAFPGTSFSWQAQQNPNVTGYPLSGTGIIPSMTLINSALNTQSVTFTVTPSLNGCFGTPVSFSINVLPCSVFVVQPSSQTACAGSNLIPVLFSGNYTSVNWTNTNAQTGLPISGTGDIAQAILTNGTSNTITSSFTAVPTYTDSNFVGASCQGPSQSFTISVLPLPNVSAGPDQELCQGQSTTLFGSGADSYSWSNNVTNGVGFLPTVTQDYVVSGTNVTTGCVNVDTVTVVVHPLPVVSAGVDQIVCKGDSISLTGSGALSYQWNNNVTDGVSFSPQTTQAYSVTGTDANGCIATDDVTVSVNETSFSTLTESALDSYTLNGQTYTQSGTYTQVITNAAGCDSTITLNLTLSFTGLEGLEQDKWNIYPNPTHDHLTIECMHEVNERFRLIDAIGRVVLTGNLAGKKTELVLTELSTGVYTLCIGNVSFRVVKQ